MLQTTPAPRPPVYRLARVALGVAILAFFLACYGSFVAETHLSDSPLRKSRPNAGRPVEPTTWGGRAVARAETAVFGQRLGPAMVALTDRSPAARYTVQLVAFVLPFVLGIVAAWLGGNALSAIEGAGRKYVGNFHAVFALLIGGLAAVISGCMVVALFVWRFVPAVYTT